MHEKRKQEETYAAEMALRRLLWLHHGHIGLYGDDGEMQCARCPLDFRRAPVQQIEERLLYHRLRGDPTLADVTGGRTR